LGTHKFGEIEEGFLAVNSKKGLDFEAQPRKKLASGANHKGKIANIYGRKGKKYTRSGAEAYSLLQLHNPEGEERKGGESDFPGFKRKGGGELPLNWRRDCCFSH